MLKPPEIIHHVVMKNRVADMLYGYYDLNGKPPKYIVMRKAQHEEWCRGNREEIGTEIRGIMFGIPIIEKEDCIIP